MRQRHWLVAGLFALLLASGCKDDDESAPARLAGTHWRLQAWSAAAPDPLDFAITAQFSDAQVSGRSAVNTYGGPYTVTAAGGITIGPLAMTEMAGPAPAMQAEQLYIDRLLRVRRYTLADTVLALSDESGTTLLTFREDDDAP